MIARNLGVFSLTPADLDVVKAGIGDGVLHKDPKVDLQAYGPKIQGLQTARLAAVAAVEKKASQAFRAASPSRSRSTASSSAGARACRS